MRIILEEEDADEGAEEEDADGVHLINLAGDEGAEEDGNADPELPGRLLWRGEVLGRHQQQAGGSKKTDDGGTQTCEDVLDHGVMLVFHQELGDDDHQDE